VAAENRSSALLPSEFMAKNHTVSRRAVDFPPDSSFVLPCLASHRLPRFEFL
jgi:hypothetical protein